MVVEIKMTDGERFTMESSKSGHAVANDVVSHQLFFEVHDDDGKLVYINPRQVISVREIES